MTNQREINVDFGHPLNEREMDTVKKITDESYRIGYSDGYVAGQAESMKSSVESFMEDLR